MSNIFREVFGDEAMPAPGKNDPRIRPLIMYQYDNANNTARDSLFFIDNYFNKTDPASPFEGTPQPPNYYIYGGGAAPHITPHPMPWVKTTTTRSRHKASADSSLLLFAMAWLQSHPQISLELRGQCRCCGLGCTQ